MIYGYCTAPFPMTLSDLQGFSPTVSLFKCIGPTSVPQCVAANKLLTDIARRAVPLQ